MSNHSMTHITSKTYESIVLYAISNIQTFPASQKTHLDDVSTKIQSRANRRHVSAADVIPNEIISFLVL